MNRIHKVKPNCPATSSDCSNRLHAIVSCKSATLSAIRAGSKLLCLSTILTAMGLSFSYQAFAAVPYITFSQDIVAIRDNCRSANNNTSASADLIAIGCDSQVPQASITVDKDSNNKAITLDKNSSMMVNSINSRSKAVTNSANSSASTNVVISGQLTTVHRDLGDSINELSYQINEVKDNANAGISAAMAMSSIPQSFLPGRSLVGGGITTYNGENAVAIGLSTVSKSGEWIIKVNGTADTQGNTGGSIGAGFHF